MNHLESKTRSQDGQSLRSRDSDTEIRLYTPKAVLKFDLTSLVIGHYRSVFEACSRHSH